MKNRIAELRKAKKLTLRDIAARLGVTQGYVSQLQHKKALPAAHRNKLAQAFGVAADEAAALDEKAIVRPRRKAAKAGAGRGGGGGARPAGLASAIAAAEDAVGRIAAALGAEERELLDLLPRISPANRRVLMTLARSFVAGR